MTDFQWFIILMVIKPAHILGPRSICCVPQFEPCVDSEEAVLEIRSGLFILLTLLSPAVTWSQTQVTDQTNPLDYVQQTPTSQNNPASAPPSDNAPGALRGQNPAPQDKKDDSKGQQTKRMLWVVPNFAAVSANTQLPPLSAREKFKLGTEDSVDYSSFVWAGLVSAQSMALRSYPEFGNGPAGYGRYYWRAFADQASGAFFTEAIIPAV